jgi:threonine/homoserine/homoserine lactone efflux protein
MPSFIEGLFYGLIFLFSFGPAFFALMQAALKHGFSRAVFVSLGVNMVDAVLIGLVMVGFSSILENDTVRFWSGFVGAIVLILFGLSSWVQSKKIQLEENTSSRTHMHFWLKGAAINGLNPMVLLFWIGVVSSVSAFGYSQIQQIGFFSGLLTSVVLIDSFKAFVIIRFSGIFTDRSLTVVNRIVGSVFIFFGFRLLVYMLGWI